MHPSHFTRSQLLLGIRYFECLLPKQVGTQKECSSDEKFFIDLRTIDARFTEQELRNIVALLDKLGKEYT